MLERVKKGEKLLDLGCAFGQELRQLVSSFGLSPVISYFDEAYHKFFET